MDSLICCKLFVTLHRKYEQREDAAGEGGEYERNI